MNEIIRHIEYLLVTNDCVVIPGFGAVIAHSIPARLDETAGCLMHPYRTFTFNAGLTQNDGLLLSSIARSKGVSYEVARHFVTTEVDAMQRQLSTAGYIRLGKIGQLTVGSEGSLSFKPSTAACFSPSFMWLDNLELQTVSDLAKIRELSNEQHETLVKRKSFAFYATRFAKLAASLAVLIALGIAFSTPINIENAQYASFGIDNFKVHNSDNVANSNFVRRPGESTSALVLVLDRHSDAEEVADTASHNAYLRSRQASKVDADKVASVTDDADAKQVTAQLRFNQDDKYCLVVASLASEAEALEFVEKSKNNQLGILSKDGRFRVYAATGETIRQAQSAVEILGDRYPGAWVCRK